MRSRAALIVSFIAGLSWSGTAGAHAFLERATPLVGSTIPTAPPEIVLQYTEAVEPRFSEVVVMDADGHRVDKNDVHIAPNDPKRLLVGLLPLKPGVYKVEWHIVSVDTHRTEGKFTFSIQP